MFCLFKNAVLPRWGQWLSGFAGWSIALWWLYFTMIEQGLGEKVLNGHALLVDLLLALPLVLFMAVILYALFYWLVRACIIVFFRQQVSFPTPKEADEDLSDQEAEFGKDYWKNHDERLF